MDYKKVLFYSSLLGILALSVIPDPDSLLDIARLSDKLNHFAAFLVLAMLIDLSHAEKRLIWKALFLGGYGLLIEAVQFFIPYRDFSFGDLVADLAGLLIYFMLKRTRVALKGNRAE